MCGAAFASAALALSTAAPGISSPTGLVVGGLATPSMHDLVMAQVLKDELHGMDRVSIGWPAEAAPYTGKTYTLGQSINIGINNLNAAIGTAVGKLVRDADGNLPANEQVKIVGLSAGSLVVTEVLRQLAQDPNAPSADELTFIVVADSSRQKLINKARYNNKYDYTYQPPPDSQYEVKVVLGEYDGLADFPDRWWNFLAIANAMAGGIFVHVPMMFADLKDEYITSVEYNEAGGKVTNYLIPTAKLPLVQLLPFLAPMEAELRAKIDKGYSRNDVVDTAPARALATPVSVTEDSVPAAAPDPTPVADVDVVEEAGTVKDVSTEVTEPAAEVVDRDGAEDTSVVIDEDADLDVVDEDSDTGSGSDDEDAANEDAANEDAEVGDADEATKDEDDASGTEDSSDSGDSGSSADSSSDGSGSSDSGSSE
ncbi:PE-PPE domain-containing protein [Mycobacterium sp. ITM-2016-00317]|nr:PE-PPE domain-containing protein [Mycobacterium sp. ITM-2016-00317]WNG85173.1 PE-PPE domain-containing protein [Mycobacterium sp. ITM-2016-00317]